MTTMLLITSTTDDELSEGSVRATSSLAAPYQQAARVYRSPGAALWLLTSTSEGLTEQLRVVWAGVASVELATVGTPRVLVDADAGAISL